jgi:anti-anti-sigma factor
MEMGTREIGTFTVIECRDDMNDEVAPRFTAFVEELIENGVRNVAIDLTRAATLSSAALGGIVRLWKQVAEAGGTLCAISTRPQINNMLQWTNVATIIRVFTSDEEFRTWVQATLPPPDMSLDVRDVRQFKIINMTEPTRAILDAREINKTIDKLIEEGNTHIAVSVAEVKHIYTDVLGVFMKIAKRLRDSGGEFRIINAYGPVLKALQFAGVTKVIDVRSDEGELGR